MSTTTKKSYEEAVNILRDVYEKIPGDGEGTLEFREDYKFNHGEGAGIVYVHKEKGLTDKIKNRIIGPREEEILTVLKPGKNWSSVKFDDDPLVEEDYFLVTRFTYKSDILGLNREDIEEIKEQYKKDMFPEWDF